VNPTVARLLFADGPAVHPATVPGCFMCFDAWRASSLTIVNTNQVSSWTDLISGTALVQGTSAARPTFNGDWVTGDGSDDHLSYTAGAISGWPLSGSMDFVGVVNQLDAPSVAGTRSMFSYPNSGNNGLLVQRAVVSNRNGLSVQIGQGASASIPGNRIADYTGKCIVRWRIPNGAVPFLWVDDVVSNASPTVTATPLFASATRHRLFAQAASTVNGFGNIAIHLLAGFNRVLTDAEWWAIRSFLRSRRRAI